MKADTVRINRNSPESRGSDGPRAAGVTGLGTRRPPAIVLIGWGGLACRARCLDCIWSIPPTLGPAFVRCTKVVRLWGLSHVGEAWRSFELKLERGRLGAYLFDQWRKACLTRWIRHPLVHQRERPGVQARKLWETAVLFKEELPDGRNYTELRGEGLAFTEAI